METQSPNAEDRTWAALAHASVLLFFFGMFAPAAIWAFMRKKSPFLAFQALQALGYQLASFFLMICGMVVVPFVFIAIMIPLELLIGDQVDVDFSLSVFTNIAMIASIVLVFGIYLLTGLIGAILCFQGKEFRYPILGNWMHRYLRSPVPAVETDVDDADNEREEKMVASFCHAGVVIPFWGMSVPFIVWLAQKDRSKLLRFQALQALIYQLVAVIVYFLYSALMPLMAMVMIVIIALAAGTGDAGSLGFIVILFFLLMMVMALLSAIAGPLYLIVAFIAAARVLGGHSFRYPLLGHLLSRWVKG